MTALDVTPAPELLQPETERGLREQLSSLQGLLALSMVMTDRGNEPDILHVATTAVPSLSSCRMEGVYLLDGGWRGTNGVRTGHEVRADVQAQLTGLGGGGPVTIRGIGWGWAYPLHSSEGHFGHFVVSADAEPPPAEVFLLRVLAQQTCIALANARLHDRERTSAEQLRSANCALAGTVEALQRKTAIHDRLTKVSIACTGQDGIADAVHELTGFPVAVEDRHGNLTAWAGPDRPTRNTRRATRSVTGRERLLARALRTGRPIRDHGRLLVVARPRDDVLGVLALVDPQHRAGEQEQVALEHGATVLAMELARLHSLAETERQLGRDTVEELLAGTNPVGAVARASALGHDLDRPHRVVVVEGHGRRGVDGFADAVRRAARGCGLGSLLLPKPGSVTVLAPAGENHGLWERLRTAVLRELPGGRCRVGVGGLCLEPADFPRSHREAQLALRLQGAASGRPDSAVSYDELGVYQLLAEIEDDTAVERHARRWLGPLLDYDANHRSALVLTLSRYLECGGSYDATAASLAVGRSTLKYRLRRIREISGHDLSDADTRFNLQLATRGWLTLHALLGTPADQ